MLYEEYRRFVEPGFVVNAKRPQVRHCHLEISFAHVMARALEAGYRLNEGAVVANGCDARDLPDGFLAHAAERVFQLAGDWIDDEGFDMAIEDAAEEFGLVITSDGGGGAS